MSALLISRIWRRLGDPAFYEKRMRALWRPFARVGARWRGDVVADYSLAKLPRAAKIVVVVAHPDDELFCAGLLCELAAKHVQVTVLCLTRGEGGHRGGVHPSELGRAREDEMRRSCELLGVKSLQFLGHIDPTGQPYRTFAPEVSTGALARQMASHFDQCLPDMIITHGSNGEYWHPAHLLVHRAVIKAARRWVAERDTDKKMSLALATFQAKQIGDTSSRFRNEDDPANFVLNVEQSYDTRLAALKCHATQLEWFLSHTAQSPEEFVKNTREETYQVRLLGGGGKS